MDFDFNMFNYVLHAVPANHIRPEAGEHSPYLQQALFDPLIQGKSIQLASLDWAAFDLRHVTLENYQAFFLEGHKRFPAGIKADLRKLSPSMPEKRKFF